MLRNTYPLRPGWRGDSWWVSCGIIWSAILLSSVGAARKVSPNWSQKTMTCHSFYCFSIVWGQRNATLVTSLPSSCHMTPAITFFVLFCFFFLIFYFNLYQHLQKQTNNNNNNNNDNNNNNKIKLIIIIIIFIEDISFTDKWFTKRKNKD